ncbi:MAG TPA: TIGR03619 family F420-dependent LLM class oxidoreductase [Gaiellaceae bacterium]|jgi:probable F420-dependent oxidoreductase
MDIGLAMSTHGLLTRDERDFFLRRLEPEAMRPIELAQLAERLGYHSLWFSDHVCMGRDLGAQHTANESGTRAYPDRPVMLDVVATIGALAAATQRVRLAPSVLIAPYRHPLTVAHQFATLDVLSDGRLIMTAGSGWDPQEFAALDADFEHRGAVTEECIEIWKHAWTEPWLDWHGRFYEIADVSLEPKPVQTPHPPIVFGAVTEAGARRAARTSDGLYPMFLDAYADPGRFDPLREVVRREGERFGRDLSDFRLYAFASGLVTDPVADDRRRTLTGSADQVLGDLERFAAHGYSHVTMHFEVASGTIEELFEIVERFAAEVLPAAAALEAAPLQ